MLNMKSYLQILINAFNDIFYFIKNRMLAYVKKSVVCYYFGIFEQDTLEFYKITIAWTLIFEACLNKLVNLKVTLFGTLKVYSMFFCCLLMVLTKTSDPR